MTSRTTHLALRGTAASCALANALIHLSLVPSHLTEKTYIGILFLVGSLVMLGVAAGLVLQRRPLGVWLIGATTSIGMIIGFLLSRTVGLPDYHEAGWEPPYGVLSLVVEGFFVLTFLAWLKEGGAGRVADLRPREASRMKAPSARLP
jgi:hypothetical protein